METPNLPSFEYAQVETLEVVGHGGFGTVSKAKFQNEIVVVKKLLGGESEDNEECFVKEAKLMNAVNHENIVKFKAFCRSP